MAFSPEQEPLQHDDFANVDSIPSVHEYEPQFKQVQEDLQYMFNIIVHDEAELHSPVIKEKMYGLAVEGLRDGNPFSLEHFAEYELITPADIKASDLPMLKQYAESILVDLRSTARLATAKKLFAEMGILEA